MKSVERHNLQTNLVAHGLEVALEKYRPYLSKILWGAVAIVVLLFIYSYLTGSSAARQSGAWDTFNQAVSSHPINLPQLRETASENPGTPMQQMADVTWADGQVMMAADAYISNRKAANQSLESAAAAYRTVLGSSTNARLSSRAQLGLARVYEMQGDVDKARKEYEQVTGTYAKYAKAQAERLAKPDAKDAYEWLAKAEAPRPVSPQGPGTPGQTPELFPKDISLPGTPGAVPGATPGSGDAVNPAEAFDALLKEMQKQPANDTDPNRYKTDEKPAGATDAATGRDASSEQPPKGLESSSDAKKDEKKGKK